MKPLINLKALLTVLLILIVPAALLVAYFRNYTTEATGHEHGEKGESAAAMGKDGEMAGMKHGDMSMAQGGQTQQTPAASQPAAQPQKDGGHAARGHGNMTQTPPAQPEQAMQAAGTTAGQSPRAHESMGAGNPPRAKSSSAMQTRPEPRQDGIKAMGTVNATIASQTGQAAVRLFHFGATDFFLDHAQHLALIPAQTTKLNQIKEQAVLDKASADRKIQETEQQLWKSTASDQPDPAEIETKVRKTENLRANKRIGFIRAVAEAAKTLTEEQRQALLGSADPSAHAQPNK